MNITSKTSILVYGASDSGKSTQARYIAEYVHRKWGKKTRLIALDRGSLWAPCQDLVDSGVVIPLEIPTDPSYNPFAILRKIRRGEWPDGGKINQPTRVESGKDVRYVTNTKWIPWSERDTEEIGAVIVDSLTSYATALMSDAKQKNLRIGGDAGSAPRTEDGEQTGTNTQSHYGDTHTEVLDSLQSFQALPVHLTLFTALEGMGTDDDGPVKRPALGPQTVGKAINSILPSRVQNCFHLSAEGVGVKKVVKAWYAKHEAQKGSSLEWPAKVGLLPHELPEFWKKYPEGFIKLSLEKGIAEYLEFRDSLRDGKEK